MKHIRRWQFSHADFDLIPPNKLFDPLLLRLMLSLRGPVSFLISATSCFHLPGLAHSLSCLMINLDMRKAVHGSPAAVHKSLAALPPSPVG